MRNCDGCGREVKREWRFCGHCGRPYPAAASGSREQGEQPLSVGQAEPRSLAAWLSLPLGAEGSEGVGFAARAGGAATLHPSPPGAAGWEGSPAAFPAGNALAPSPKAADQLTPLGQADLRGALVRLRRSDRVVAIGAFVLFVSLFLPWFGFGFGGSVSGLDAHGWLFLVLLACLGLLGYLAWTAVRLGMAQTAAHWQGLIGMTGFSSLLTLIALVVSPSGSSLQIGAILALGGAGTSLAGAIATRYAVVREAVDRQGRRLDLVTAVADLLGRLRTAPQASSPPSVAQRPGVPWSPSEPGKVPDPATRTSAVNPAAAPERKSEQGPARAGAPTGAELSKPAPDIRSSNLAIPAGAKPRQRGNRAITGGAWVSAIGAVIALIAWLVYYRPVSAARPPATGGHLAHRLALTLTRQGNWYRTGRGWRRRRRGAYCSGSAHVPAAHLRCTSCPSKLCPRGGQPFRHTTSDPGIRQLEQPRESTRSSAEQQRRRRTRWELGGQLVWQS